MKLSGAIIKLNICYCIELCTQHTHTFNISYIYIFTKKIIHRSSILLKLILSLYAGNIIAKLDKLIFYVGSLKIYLFSLQKTVISTLRNIKTIVFRKITEYLLHWSSFWNILDNFKFKIFKTIFFLLNW